MCVFQLNFNSLGRHVSSSESILVNHGLLSWYLFLLFYISILPVDMWRYAPGSYSRQDTLHLPVYPVFKKDTSSSFFNIHNSRTITYLSETWQLSSAASICYFQYIFQGISDLQNYRRWARQKELVKITWVTYFSPASGTVFVINQINALVNAQFYFHFESKPR